MRLWVDDERPAPEGWVWAKNSDDAIDYLKHAYNPQLQSLGMVDDIEAISLDHDLGFNDTSRRIVLWMCEHDCWPSVVFVHTANPVRREWLEGMVDRYGPGVSR